MFERNWAIVLGTGGRKALVDKFFVFGIIALECLNIVTR